MAQALVRGPDWWSSLFTRHSNFSQHFEQSLESERFAEIICSFIRQCCSRSDRSDEIILDLRILDYRPILRHACRPSFQNTDLK